MSERPNPDSRDMEEMNTTMDTIGEVLNISMGAAATAVSILLNRHVTITEPSVKEASSPELDLLKLEPALGIQVEYTQGLMGVNQILMRREDARVIVRLLLGESLDEPNQDAGLDELHMSALGEIMSQMMGASCTALASFLEMEVHIAPPVPYQPSEIKKRLAPLSKDGNLVTAGFRLKIEGLVDSEFLYVLPTTFAEELVQGAQRADARTLKTPPPAPAPVRASVPAEAPRAAAQPIKTTYQAPRAAAPAPAPIPQPAPAPASGFVAPKAGNHKNIVVKPLQFASLDKAADPMDDMDPVNLGLVMGVDLNVTVEIGRAKKQVKEILALRQGSIVELDKQAGDPVDILVNGKLIARGDVVVIDDNFGVRITEILGGKIGR